MWGTHQWRRTALALLTLTAVVCGVIASSASAPGAIAGPAAISSAGWGRSPAAARAAISGVLGRDDRAFRVVSGRAGLSAHNPSQALAARFGPGGVRIISGRLEVGLALSSLGRGSQLAPVSPASPRARANRVVYGHGALTEWFVNGPLGLEQGFTVGREPRRGTGPLTLAVHVSGNALARASGSDAVLLTGPRATHLRYGGLVAADARGRALAASLVVRHQRVLIRVDDRRATYPVRIDPFIQQAKLTDPTGVSSAALGQQSLAATSDIAVASVNAPAGSEDVFLAAPGGWAAGATLAARLTAGVAGDSFGASVAISADGTTVAVGAPGTTIGANAGQGEVYVFQRPPGGWSGSPLPTARLDNTATGAASDGLGHAVSVSPDGSLIAAGLPQQSGSATKGAVYVFARGGGGWINQTTPQAILTNGTSGAVGDWLGFSVAMAGDTIVAGAPGVNSFTGGASVFEMPSTGWATTSTPNAELFVGGGQAGDRFGWSVAVSQTAKTIVAGAIFANNFAGAAYVYSRPGTDWTTRQQDATLTTSGAGATPGLGSSVAIDGNTVVAGAPFAIVNNQPSQGTADVYAKPASGWANASQDASLAASDGTGGDSLGTTVAIANGTVIASAPGAKIGGNAGQGALYAFGSVPVTSVTLTPASPNGKNGWYTVPVSVAVSAVDLDSPIAQTDCVLDPASPPGDFRAIPPSCPFAGAGAPVGGDGQHTVYAASENQAGNQESPKSATFRIDRTPPALTCAGTPAFQLGGAGGFVSASVADATSGPATPTVSVEVSAAQFGLHLASLTGFDNAGNSATISCPYAVTAPALRPSPTMSWTFRPTRTFTSVLFMLASSVPGPADIVMSCRGGGCPFRSHTVRSGTVKKCKGKGRHRKCTRHKPGTHSVNLTRLFSKRHLKPGTRLTIEFVQTNRVGKVFVFKTRSKRQPSVKVSCLAPGSNTPGRGC